MAKKTKKLLNFTEPQHAFIVREAKRLGISFTEVVRRIIEEHMKNAAKLLITVALLSAGSMAEAQSLRTATKVFVVASAADWASTHYSLSAGGVERNAPVAWINSTNPHTVTALGVGFDAVGAWAWNHYVGRCKADAYGYRPETCTRKRIAALGLYAMSAYRVKLTLQNVRTGREMRRR